MPFSNKLVIGEFTLFLKFDMTSVPPVGLLRPLTDVLLRRGTRGGEMGEFSPPFF